MDEQQESSIGFCNSWSDLEKRRKALDLFLLKQFEVVGGVPQKVFYECGTTPTCPYKISAIRNESSGAFELFEYGSHSHPIRSVATSAFLVDLAIESSTSYSKNNDAKSPLISSSSNVDTASPKQIGINPNITSPTTSETVMQFDDEAEQNQHSTNVQRKNQSRPQQKRSIKAKNSSPMAKKWANKIAKKYKEETDSDEEDNDSDGMDNEESAAPSTNSKNVTQRKLPPRNAKLITQLIQQNSPSKRITRQNNARGTSTTPIESNHNHPISNNGSGKSINYELASLMRWENENSTPTTSRNQNSSSTKNLFRSKEVKKNIPNPRKASPSSSSNISTTSISNYSSSSTLQLQNTSKNPINSKSKPNDNSAGPSHKKQSISGSNKQNKDKIVYKPQKSRRIRTEDGIIWKWLATICGDANLLKFRQTRQMSISSRLRWNCKLNAKCDYEMLVKKEEGDEDPTIYQIYVFGEHNHQN